LYWNKCVHPFLRFDHLEKDQQKQNLVKRMYFSNKKLRVRSNIQVKKEEEEYSKKNYHESVATM